MWLLWACASGSDTGLDCEAREPALDYANFGEGFLRKHCTACHSSAIEDAEMRNGAPVGVDLDTYDDAFALAERIRARVIDPESPTMPPGGGPTEEELAQLDEWLACDLEAP